MCPRWALRSVQDLNFLRPADSRVWRSVSSEISNSSGATVSAGIAILQRIIASISILFRVPISIRVSPAVRVLQPIDGCGIGFLSSPLLQVLGEALGIFPEVCTAGLFGPRVDWRSFP